MKRAYLVVFTIFCLINFGCGSSNSSKSSPKQSDNMKPVFAYVTNDDVSSISVFSIDTNNGRLSPTQTLATSGGGATYAEISGGFLFVTAKLANSISSFAIDPLNGTLSPVPGGTVSTGTTPFNLTLDPDGRFLYLANVASNNVSAYVVNNNGTLAEIAGSPFASGLAPYSLVTDKSGRFLYVTNRDSNNVSGYAIDKVTGALASIAGSPFAAGRGARAIELSKDGKFVFVPNRFEKHHCVPCRLEQWRVDSGSRFSLPNRNRPPFGGR
jgi:6-phosphogluconolactonase (cycloisomerase 2 family)